MDKLNNLLKLEEFFKETSIPSINKRPLTFLGISKQPHFENVWSNIYAFFFDPTAEHNLGDLFLKSLTQLINEETNKSFYFSPPFDINTEYSTKKNGRIDLLLSSANEAIIIENKVYHHLKNNDLHDYWNSVTQKTKQGIILSLKKLKNSDPGHPDFIGISHLEFLRCVIANLPDYFSNANEKYILFLKDFYQNIINITNPMDTNIIKFYLEKTKEINHITELRKNYVNYVISEVEKAREIIKEKFEEEFESYGSNNEKYRLFRCPKQRDLMITIVFEGLFTESRNLEIIVELQNDLSKQDEKIKNINFEAEEEDLIEYNNKFYTPTILHFAKYKTKELTEINILDLGNYISEEINKSPILSIYRKLKTALVDEISGEIFINRSKL